MKAMSSKRNTNEDRRKKGERVKQLAIYSTEKGERNWSQSKELTHLRHEGPDTDVAVVDLATAHSVVDEVNLDCPHHVQKRWKTAKKEVQSNVPKRKGKTEPAKRMPVVLGSIS